MSKKVLVILPGSSDDDDDKIPQRKIGEQWKKDPAKGRHHYEKWTKTRNTSLLMLLFQRRPLAEMMEILGTNADGVRLQFPKICQRYSEWPRNSAPEFEVGDRSGHEWVEEDFYLLHFTFSPMGRKVNGYFQRIGSLLLYVHKNIASIDVGMGIIHVAGTDG